MECICLHRHLWTTLGDAIVLTEHWLNTTRSLDHQKGLYESTHDYPGWKKWEGGGEQGGPDLHPGVGELKQGRDSWIPGKSVGTEGKHLKNQRRVKRLICDSLHRVGTTRTVCHRPVYPGLDSRPPVHTGARAGAWGLESNPTVRTAIDCREMVWGNGRKEVRNRGCLWRKCWRHWKQGTVA